MIARLRSQDGMTLPEVLVAATVGFVVLAATLGLLESSVRLNTGVMGKTDAMQRGRLAMDRLTQELRSQVCLNLTTPAVLPVVSTADSITFYSDFGDGSATEAPPIKRTITFDPATGNITETSVQGTSTGNGNGNFTFTNVPQKQVLFENATRVVEADSTVVPFLKYFAYEDKGTPLVRSTTLELSPPLDAASAARVARIEIAFAARPTGLKDAAKHSTDIKDQVTVRHADPNLTVPDPLCV
jgi:Tfp pilus assembly protein PilW